MTNTAAENPATWRRFLFQASAIFAALAALCTVFAVIATLANAWQEHEQAAWPQAAASVINCEIAETSSSSRRYNIRCRLKFIANFQQARTTVYSIDVPPADAVQYPLNQIAPFIDWVNAHPPGTSLVVRYNPTQPSKIIMAGDYMPMGGPQTPNDIKLAGACAVSFLVLFLIARITRPRFLGDEEYS